MTHHEEVALIRKLTVALVVTTMLVSCPIQHDELTCCPSRLKCKSAHAQKCGRVVEWRCQFCRVSMTMHTILSDVENQLDPDI